MNKVLLVKLVLLAQEVLLVHLVHLARMVSLDTLVLSAQPVLVVPMVKAVQLAPLVLPDFLVCLVSLVVVMKFLDMRENTELTRPPKKPRTTKLVPP